MSSLEDAQNYLGQFANSSFLTKNGIDYQAIWEVEFDKLRKKIHELREKNLNFDLIAAKMRKMNEAKKFIFSESNHGKFDNH